MSNEFSVIIKDFYFSALPGTNSENKLRFLRRGDLNGGFNRKWLDNKLWII
jgi:hypothetical protein